MQQLLSMFIIKKIIRHSRRTSAFFITMHKLLPLILSSLLLSILISHLCEVRADDQSGPTALILDSAEGFFISLKDEEYEAVWDSLSEKSHNTIIDNVYDASIKINKHTKKEDVEKDFKNKGILFNNYWKAFHDTFDSETVLEKSMWKMGVIKKNRAEILLTNKKTGRLARVKMSNEQGTWKVGLVETFWPKKAVSLLKDFSRFIY